MLENKIDLQIINNNKPAAYVPIIPSTPAINTCLVQLSKLIASVRV